VQYPPPPARVEFIPKRPAPDALWVDGEWVWRGRRWAWKVGRWIKAPDGARFSPWTMVLGPQGTVYYAAGVWRDVHNAALPDPAALATATVNSGEVDDPEGDAEDTGHILHPQTP
jgi:hypothetical protein